MAASDRTLTSLQMTGVKPVPTAVDVDAAAARLSRAITFPTISNQDRSDFDTAAFDDFHKHLAESFPRVHATLTKELLGDPRPYSLLYTWKGTDPSLEPVVLMGHQDVVPVVPETKKQWEHDAFSGDIADGYIWGRGSLDDKVMVMAILEAVEMQLAAGFQPKRTIYLSFGQDEEVMGLEGTRNIVESLKERGVDKVAFVLDEGVAMTTGLFPGVDGPVALIGTAEKGYATLKFEVAGAGGHSAMPPEHSAIGVLARAIKRLEDSPFPYHVTQAVRDQYRFLGSALPANQQAIVADVVFGPAPAPPAPTGGDDPTGPTAGWHVGHESEDAFIANMRTNAQSNAMLHTTTAVTMINGGNKENVLPTSATAMVNFRILQEETVDGLLNQVENIIGDDQVTITVEDNAVDPSPVADPTSTEYKLLEKSIREAWDLPGIMVSPYLVIGGCDAKYYAAKLATNVFRFTALHVESAADLGRWHGINERVLVKEYGVTIGFFFRMITNLQDL